MEHYENYSLENIVYIDSFGNEKTEEWKPVVSWEGIYMISSLGRMISLNYNHTKKAKIKKCSSSKKKSDYRHFYMQLGSRHSTVVSHRLVAQAFIPNPDNLPIINHINGIKNDNRVCNLEWCDQSYNSLHAYNMELRKPTLGTINGMSKLNEKKVLEIRRLSSTMKQKDLAKKFKVNIPTISRVINRVLWKHI